MAAGIQASRCPGSGKQAVKAKCPECGVATTVNETPIAHASGKVKVHNHLVFRLF